MSNVPDIDRLKIIKKFSEKNTDLTYQVIQYEVLCETLIEQKEALVKDRADFAQKIAELTTELAKYRNAAEVFDASIVEETE